MIEPLLEVREIQGHVLPGFGTRYLRILGFRICEVAGLKQAIQPWLERLTDAETAHAKRIVRAVHRAETGKRPDDPDVMTAIGFSSTGLVRLGTALRDLKDRAFKRDMRRDAPQLNDDYDFVNGEPIGWRFGGTETNTPDILVLCGCEQLDSLEDHCRRLIADLGGVANVVADECGDRPDDDKEHFGFKDGVSQPSVRGYIRVGEYFQRRHLDPADPLHDIQSKPGHPLIWPGQVVFGYPRQTAASRRPGRIRDPGVDWMRNGSYLVVRRLSQDVAQFRAAVDKAAEVIGQDQGIHVDPEILMAKLVGRWKDGTPLVASPDGPDASISSDPMRLNHFNFDSVAPAVRLASGVKTSSVLGDSDEVKCPRMSHIRKINPRDGQTAIGNELTLTKLIARRGINFGPRFDRRTPDEDRGLLFMCYQTSISGQFVFLQQNWANTDQRPTTAGHDMIIGQDGPDSPGRSGHLKLDGRTCPISMNGDWVRMTGGGYFAVPSISGVNWLLRV